MTTPAGWYPDPSGLWEVRWFDGAAWSDQVATGGAQATEPYPLALQAPANPATVLWFGSGTSEHEPARLDLTWQSLDFVPLKRPQETRRFPLGFVAGVVVERLSPDGSGGLRILVRGPGYVGPSTFLIKGMERVLWGRAMILRQRAIATGIPAANS